VQRDIDHSALAVAGYTTPWAVAPARSVSLHLSVAEDVRRVTVSRIDLDTPVDVDWTIRALADKAAHRTFEQGSYLVLDETELGKVGDVTALSFELFLTRNPGRRVVVASGDLTVELIDGALTAHVSGRKVATSKPLPEKPGCCLI